MRIIQLVFLVLTMNFTSCAQSNDAIISVWNVTTDLYTAIYEIVPYRGKFYGKVHYFNDGNMEYIGSNEKEDYFLTDVENKEGEYLGGKMYTPTGSYYEVIFELKDENTLEALMTVQGKAYKETWKRKLN